MIYLSSVSFHCPRRQKKSLTIHLIIVSTMNEKKNSLIKNFVAKLKSKTKPPFTETVNPTCPARYLL